jgi:hypothetical protein
LLAVVLAAEAVGRAREQQQHGFRNRRPVALLRLHLLRSEAVLLERCHQLRQRGVDIGELLLTEDPHRLEEPFRLRRAVRRHVAQHHRKVHRLTIDHHAGRSRL